MRVRILEKSFINNTLIDPETMEPHQCIVEYDPGPSGSLSSNMEKVEDIEKPDLPKRR